MTDKFVIYLGSSDSQNVHPANSNTDFIIDLPTQLLLDGEWGDVKTYPHSLITGRTTCGKLIIIHVYLVLITGRTTCGKLIIM